MKVKNILKDDRKLLIGGQIFVVGPGKTIEGNKIIFEPNSFEEIKEKSLSVAKKKNIKTKEDKE